MIYEEQVLVLQPGLVCSGERPSQCLALLYPLDLEFNRGGSEEGLIRQFKNMELFNKSYATLALTLPRTNFSVYSLSDNVLLKNCEPVTKVACDWLKSLAGNKIVAAPLWCENTYRNIHQ